MLIFHKESYLYGFCNKNGINFQCLNNLLSITFIEFLLAAPFSLHRDRSPSLYLCRLWKVLVCPRTHFERPTPIGRLDMKHTTICCGFSHLLRHVAYSRLGVVFFASTRNTINYKSCASVKITLYIHYDPLAASHWFFPFSWGIRKLDAPKCYPRQIITTRFLPFAFPWEFLFPWEFSKHQRMRLVH